jgi:hypothetical protein
MEMDRQRKGAIVTGLVLAAIALAIYLFTIFTYMS